MSTRSIPLVLGILAAVGLLAPPTHAGVGEAAAWLREGDPIVLLLVVDGLRPEAIEAQAPWDGPLMPRTREWSRHALRWTDLWAETGDPVRSTAQLLFGGGILPRPLDPHSGFGRLIRDGARSWAITGPTDLSSLPSWAVAPVEAPPGEGRCVGAKDRQWLAAEEARVFEALDAAAHHPGPALIVAHVDHLLPPWVVRSSTLEALDPRPWAEAPRAPVEIELLVQKRLRIALDRAGSAAPLRPRPTTRDLEIYRWVVSAAHRDFDTFLGHLADRASAPELRPRLSWILTASGSTSYDRHDLARSGRGAVVDALHVPLIWSLPPRFEVEGIRPGAHTLRQLAECIEAWKDHPDADPGLFGPPLPQRFAFARSRVDPGSPLRPWAQLRWSTQDFTLVDEITVAHRIALYDRRIDPREGNDRGDFAQAQWDSLRTELLRRVLGPRATLEIEARGVEVGEFRFSVGATPAEVRIPERGAVEVTRHRRGSLIHWTPPPSDRTTLRIEVPSESAVLGLRREWSGPRRLWLGTRPLVLPARGEVRILPGASAFYDLLDRRPAEADSVGITLRWRGTGWWQ